VARPIDYGEPKPMTAERILLRGGVLLAAAVGIGALGGWNKAVRAASDHAALPDVGIVARELGSLSEQLEAANAHLIGSVLNSVDLVRNPYYYSAYYRKEYSRYYVSAGAGR